MLWRGTESGLPISSPLSNRNKRIEKECIVMLHLTDTPMRRLRLVLSLSVCTLCLSGHPLTQAAERAVIESVSTTSEQVSIALSGPVSFQHAALHADARHRRPHRCYVDISPAVLGKQILASIDVEAGTIRRVRAGQFQSDTARIVLDLSSAQVCHVQLLTHPNRIAIVVGQLPTQLASTGPLTEGSPTDSKPLATHDQPAADAPPDSSAGAGTLPAAQPVSDVELQIPGENTAPELDPNFSSRLSQGPIIPLPEAYHLAIQNEERIKIAGRELGKAQLLPWRAVAHLTPRSDIRGIYTRNKDEIAFSGAGGVGGAADLFGGASTIRPLERWTGVFSITQPILEPSFFASRTLGKASVQESQERYNFTIREILLGVARAYYSVLRSQAQVTVARDTLALSQDELRQAQVRFRVGEVTKTDVLRAEVAVERGERTVVTDHNRLRLAYTTLARTIGVPEPLGVMEPQPAVYSPVPYSQLLEQAYAQRQDFRAQEIRVDIVKQQKNLVLARYLPRVNARWEFPRLDVETFAERDKFWTLFLNFEIPLFDGGTRELDLLEQNENLAQSKLRVDQMRKDIQVEVKDALVTVETLGSTLNTLEKEVNLARENYNITSKQYRVGLATSLDLNTSLNALNQVRTQLIDQTYAYQVALLRLQQTTGVFAQDYLP